MSKLASSLIERRSRPDQVAPRVFAIREHLGMSKAEFSEAVSVDRSSLTKIEKGTAGLDIAVAERIAELFGFGLDFIYRGDLADVPLAHRPEILSLMHSHRTTL
ncbi:helix-turn-helix domain-containing protein [Pararhodobacter zhoushanensis]|uniref:helix-turn-helix domain-containing protein n=1 Tax=Pararhodobacter zhoushanensis TaxID=2479545 RepID=UPI0013DE97EE|nr:helix-turn-helix transcriptional regulator [Pararhodobacter zhoushanensis]